MITGAIVVAPQPRKTNDMNIIERIIRTVRGGGASLLLVIALASSAAAQSASRIVFDGYFRNVRRIWAMNDDGSGTVLLTNSKKSVGDFQPAWSPGQQYIAFYRYGGKTGSHGPTGIFVMEAKGEANGGRTFQVSNAFGLVGLDWSPDGTRILFTQNVNGADDIFVVTVDFVNGAGINPTPLTATPLNEFYPKWSPDGNRIAFVRCLNPPGSSTCGEGLFILDLATGSEIGPFAVAFAPSYLNWSPDGSRIAFSGAGGIYLMNSDGSNVTFTNISAGQPAWSPDGTAIACQSNQNGQAGIYRVNLATGAFKLLKLYGYDPDWSP